MADIYVGKVWGKSRAGIADLLGMGCLATCQIYFFFLIINNSVGSDFPGEIFWNPGPIRTIRIF